MLELFGFGFFCGRLAAANSAPGSISAAIVTLICASGRERRRIEVRRVTETAASGCAPQTLLDALAETVVGQRPILEALLHALIAGGHVVLEGPPGLAKTLSCRALASAVGGTFKRVQFTPDLLPSDIVGTRVFDQRSAEFATAFGPIFANIVLADEINRAPAKVQSACSRRCRSIR